jgi:hypothetical protein
MRNVQLNLSRLVIDNITKEDRAWLATNDLLLRAPREVR